MLLAQFTQVDQVWTNAADIGRALRTDSALQFSSPRDQEAWNASPAGQHFSQEFPSTSGSQGRGLREQAVVDISDLPTDPDQLATVIASGGLHTNIDLIPSGDNATFQRSAALLLGPDVGMSPSLASALFQVLANQPGTRLVGRVADHNGQEGDGVVLTSPKSERPSEVIVDPTSGAVLEAVFAPPPSTLPARGGETCVGSGSKTPTCSSSIIRAVSDRVWTDLVATGIVGANTATLPPPDAPPRGLRAPTKAVVTSSVRKLGASWVQPSCNRGTSPMVDHRLRQAAVLDGGSEDEYPAWSVSKTASEPTDDALRACTSTTSSVTNWLTSKRSPPSSNGLKSCAIGNDSARSVRSRTNKLDSLVDKG